MDQNQTGSQPAFYHNKSKHTKSPERFSAIKTPTPSPASISASCATSLSPSNSPFLSATPSSSSLSIYRSPRCISSISLSSFFPLCRSVFLSSCLQSIYSTPPWRRTQPPTHTMFLFFLTNLLLMCVYILSSHSFNSVSLSVLSEGLSWKRLPPTHSLFSFQLDIRFTFTMNKHSVSHVA